MSWWSATIIVLGSVVGGVILFNLSLEGSKRLMLRAGKAWHSIDYPDDGAPPFGLSLIGPILTDKQGNPHFGAYLVDYNRAERTARILWIIKPSIQ